MQVRTAWLFGGLLFFGWIGAAQAVFVPGNANPFLAGVETSGAYGNGDHVPTNSPVAVPLTIATGYIAFPTVTGGMNYSGGTPSADPDGSSSGGTSTNASDQLGKSQLSAPWNSLVGVFLDDSDPSSLTPPAGLSFTNSADRLFTELHPLLRQTFFIGDGLGAGDVLQKFYIPSGATRLFLAGFDGSGWYNNSGGFEVSISQVPEPTTVALLLLTAAGMGVARRRPTRKM